MGLNLARLNNKDFAAGILYLTLGIGFAAASTRYKLGTSSNMGSGYLPFWMGIILAGIGIAVAVHAVRRDDPAARLERWDLRRMVLVLGAVALFGLLVKPLGIVVAMAILILVASLATPESRPRETLVSILVLPPVISLFFVKLLGMSFPLLPVFLN